MGTTEPISEPLAVFVYGTLKPGEANYQRFCEGNVTASQVALTPGKFYQIPDTISPCLPKGYPGMTLETGWVEGYLLAFSDPKILSQLDALEEYQPGRSPEENYYQRQSIPIYTLDKIFIQNAWGYVMTLERINSLKGTPINHQAW